MALVKLKPTSAGRRHAVKVVNKELHKGKPWAALTEKKNRGSGRNNNGHITCRHKGGGAKRAYRIIDFKRQKDGVPARVERIEYDPNRSAHIALVCYADGERCYIIAPKGLTVGQEIMNGPESPIKVGNTLPLRNIPVGSTIHCIEMLPGKGAQMVRAAGAFAQLVAREGEYAQIRLRSGEVRRVLIECRATIGTVGNFASEAIARMEADGIRVAHYDLRFAKPLDQELLHEVGRKFRCVVTVEDGALRGGVGEAVVAFFCEHGYLPKVVSLGIPDRFVEHGTPAQLYAQCGYDAEGIYRTLKSLQESLQ